MAEQAEERGVIPAQPVRVRWKLPPPVRRLLTMPLRDPFAFAGIVIYLLYGYSHSWLRHHYSDAPDLPEIEPDADASETPTPEAR